MGQMYSSPSTFEVDVQRQLRKMILEEIDKRQLTVEQLALELDLLPSGAQALLEKSVWPIEIALRIAERLNIQLNVQTGNLRFEPA